MKNAVLISEAKRNSLLDECCNLQYSFPLSERFATGKYCRAHSSKLIWSEKIQNKAEFVRVKCFVQDICFDYIEIFCLKL